MKSTNNSPTSDTDADAEKIDKTAPPLSRHDSEMSVDSGYSSPQDPLLQATNSIKSQYFKTLYSTKTSLAYFAKSALSRARSEFSVMQPQEESLISFLENMILDIEDFSTKYDVFLPGVITSPGEDTAMIIWQDEHPLLVQMLARHATDKEGEDKKVAQLKDIKELKIREYISCFWG